MNSSEPYRYRRRIKTEVPTNATSPVIKPTTPQQSFLEQQNKLPPIFRENHHNNDRKPKESELEKYIHRLSMIDEEEGDKNKSYWKQINNRRNTLSLSPRKRKQIQKAEKIYGLLCHQPQSNTAESPQQMPLKSSKARVNQRHSQIYEQAQMMYEHMKKKKKTKDVQEIFNFINVLKNFNNLFVKLDDMLGLILLKKGRVHEFEQNFIVYSQNQLQNSLLIILWGDIKLKEVYKNKSRYSIPGDMLCEEVILESNGKKKYFSEISFCKGSLISNQTAKTLTHCGMLEVTKEVYQEIKSRFIQNGQKDKIMVFQRMLAWSLSKKSNLRK